MFDKKKAPTHAKHQMKQSFASAERHIHSSKSITFNNFSGERTHFCINKMQSFFETIESRIDRVTRSAQHKVTKWNTPHVVSLAAEQLSDFVSKPRLQLLKTLE